MHDHHEPQWSSSSTQRNSICVHKKSFVLFYFTIISKKCKKKINHSLDIKRVSSSCNLPLTKIEKENLSNWSWTRWKQTGISFITVNFCLSLFSYLHHWTEMLLLSSWLSFLARNPHSFISFYFISFADDLMSIINIGVENKE